MFRRRYLSSRPLLLFLVVSAALAVLLYLWRNNQPVARKWATETNLDDISIRPAEEGDFLQSGQCRGGRASQSPELISAAQTGMRYDCRFKLRRQDLRLPKTKPSRHVFARRTNKIIGIEDYANELNFLWFDVLGESFRRHSIHRKPWEWATGLTALQDLGMLKKSKVGVEVAAGHEPVIFYLSRRVKKLYATDIYGAGGYATDGTSQKDILINPGKFAKIPFDPAGLEVMYMDAKNLSYFNTSSVDFVSSFSSLEHFGGLQGACASMREQARIVITGGAVIVITEIVLNREQGSYFPFSPKDLEGLLQCSRQYGLQLIEDIDFSISDLTLATAVDMQDATCAQYDPHLILCNKFNNEIEYTCYTSIMLAFTKVTP